MLGTLSKERLHPRCIQVQVIELIDGVEVDRDRHQLTIHGGQHLVLVDPPLGELGQVFEDLFRLRVEDVRAVQVNQHTLLVVEVIRIASDVRPLVHHQNAFAHTHGQLFGKHGTRETRADDQVIVAFP